MHSTSEIIDNLFIGEFFSSYPVQIRDLGIELIIDVTCDVCYFNYPNVDYIQIPIEDDEYTNIVKYFNYTYNLIDNKLKKGKKVLVYCQAGVSRSPTIVIAYLMKKLNINLTEAYELVLSKRSIVKPNSGFYFQLKLYNIFLSTKHFVEQKIYQCQLFTCFITD